jgi:hypothetical protein
LRLLRAFVEGQLDLSNVPAEVGDALVGTARGHKDGQTATAVLASIDDRQRAREQVIQLLTESHFGSADLAMIRRVLESLKAQALEAEALAQAEEVPAGAATRARRFGSVWLELKYIPDADSGRTYGPYLYGRWREAGRKRSRYIGKA